MLLEVALVAVVYYDHRRLTLSLVLLPLVRLLSLTVTRLSKVLV